MKKHLAIFAAAAFALGGVSMTFGEDKDLGDKTKDTARDVRDKTAQTLGVGSADQASQEQSKHAEAIHDVMAQVAEAALTKNGLNDVVERFVDADRNRLGQNADALKNDDALNNQIAQLQSDWKAKYNNDFDIKDEDKVYNLNFARVMEGEEAGARTAGATISGDATKTDSGTTASGKVGGVTGDATVNTDTGTAKVDVDNKTGVDKPNSDAADANRNDRGRNIATIHIAESHGLPALDVPMIHEAGGWKLDIPDSVDANKFKTNMSQALTDISGMKAQWPADAEEAYRHVTHRVLLAIFDKQATAGAGAGAGAIDTGASQSK